MTIERFEDIETQNSQESSVRTQGSRPCFATMDSLPPFTIYHLDYRSWATDFGRWILAR
jgi:hypothetical protein